MSEKQKRDAINYDQMRIHNGSTNKSGERKKMLKDCAFAHKTEVK